MARVVRFNGAVGASHGSCRFVSHRRPVPPIAGHPLLALLWTAMITHLPTEAQCNPANTLFNDLFDPEYRYAERKRLSPARSRP